MFIKNIGAEPQSARTRARSFPEQEIIAEDQQNGKKCVEKFLTNPCFFF